MKCRLCLIKCHEGNGVSLFNKEEESNLANLVAKYLYIEVTPLDVFSKMMCTGCVQHLNTFHKFFQYVEQQQQVLQNEFLEVKCVVSEKPFIANTDFDGVQTNLEHNDESMLDIKDVINDDEKCLDRSMYINELGFAGDHFETTTRNENENESEEDLPLQMLLNKVKKSIQIGTASVTIKKSKRAVKIDKRKYIKEKSSHADKDLDAKRSHNADIPKESEKKTKYFLTPEEDKFRDEIVSNYIHLKCEICNNCVETYNDLRKHFRKEHKRQAYITCCGKRFLRRSLLWDHIQSHLHPDRFKCEFCEKILKSRASLKLHMANMHVDRNEMVHACHICDKKFPYMSILNSHMIVHTDELNHLCKTCGKGFKTYHMLKMHIQHVHAKRSPFICESCGKEYRIKQSLERHIATHQGHPSEPTEQCTICGQWLRNNCLRKHMQRHENRTFECEICKKICKSKSSLTSHIDYCHKMKQVHSCTLCNKAFKKKMLLKEHMAMHAGRKDYNCPHCLREFRSKANMYSHIKKTHVEEWTKAQIARNQGPTERKDK